MSDSIPALTIVRMIPAVPEKVFEAWLEPKFLSTFMCPAHGMKTGKIVVDARVGGAFSIEMIVGTQVLPHHGKYLAIEKYTRLVFTWLSHVAGEGSQVSLRFEPAANGFTRLTLEHVGLADEAKRSQHEAGWTRILSELATHV